MCLSALHPFKVIHLKNLLFQVRETDNSKQTNKKNNITKVKGGSASYGAIRWSFSCMDWTGLDLVCT